ncbi:MAG: ribonuclease H-like domain-containing protein [Anaerolineales bacterium]|nr:ribonuclease H-like domain-containing protein [Anaerolineales bacterium]
MSSTDLRTRLQRLRAHKQRPSQPAAPPVARPARAARRATDLPGERVETPLGVYQRIETSYAFDFAHGPKCLADLFAHAPATAARLARDEALAAADLRALAFIDTETTGLAGGAGTLVFLVGVGACEAGRFVLRQYFLIDPGEEPALLTALVNDLAPRTGWVTFNGRAFDLPLIETRLTLNRQRGALGQRPHLDLLMPARRLYRGRLPSCSLGDIERHVFHIQREDDDVPGWLIPQLYADYLRTGDPREMRRVIYHNTVDILSMVTLAAHLMDVFATPLGPAGAVGGGRTRAPARPETAPTLPHPVPEDLLRLACWHDDNGRPAEAEAAFKAALAGKLKLPDRERGLARLAALLKRQARRAEAVPVWEQLASFTLDDPTPFVELAKYYEWHARDLGRAQTWTQRALALVKGWDSGWRRDATAALLTRRLERVAAKLAH